MITPKYSISEPAKKVMQNIEMLAFIVRTFTYQLGLSISNSIKKYVSNTCHSNIHQPSLLYSIKHKH